MERTSTSSGAPARASHSRPPAPDFDLSPTRATAGKPCPRCTTENDIKNRFCAECGFDLSGNLKAAAAPGTAPIVSVATQAAPAPSAIVCPRCKGANDPPGDFCRYCGAQLSQGHATPDHAQTLGGAPQSPVTAQRGPRAQLVVITQDGSPGRAYALADGGADIGSQEGSVRLPNDPYVCPRHARVEWKNGQFSVRDLGSVNGTYMRVRGAARLRHADLVLIGLEVLKFELVSDAEAGLGPAMERGAQLFGSPAAPRYARLCERTIEGVTRNVFYISKDETIIGREAGDVVFTSDPFMSRQHATITRNAENGEFTLRDLGSSNGTYLAIHGEVALSPGDHVRIGQHLFRLDVEAGQA